MTAPKNVTGLINTTTSANYLGGATNYIIETPSGVLYSINRDLTNSSPVLCKSIDGGVRWSNPVRLNTTTTCFQISVWYDRWSGIDADLIHVVFSDIDSDDIFYLNINTANSDAVSAVSTVFTGLSVANGGALSISRMRGGNLIVCGCIDAGTEEVNRKSTDVGANWADIAVGHEDASSGDLCIVMPGWGADNQDAMMFYYDRSATEISVKYYDDSANTWSETSIATSISLPAVTASFGHMNAAVDITNSQNLICFWTAVDTGNADLRVFKVTQSAQTETASNVVLNSVDDQGFCAISVLGSNWYVYYFGNSDGSDQYAAVLKLYYKKSIDSGATWQAEINFSNNLPNNGNTYVIIPNPVTYRYESVATVCNANPVMIYYTKYAIPRATYQLGI